MHRLSKKSYVCLPVYRRQKALRRVASPYKQNEPNHWRQIWRAVQARGQEGDKSLLVHLAGAHRELAVMNRPMTAGMAVNRYVVRWIDKHHVGHLTCHDATKRLDLEGVATEHAVLAQLPEIPRLRLNLPGSEVTAPDRSYVIPHISRA